LFSGCTDISIYESRNAEHLMALPGSFTFSQASLQDYTDCPRRFQLRYVLGVRWPTARDGPVIEWEQRVQQGVVFHRMVQQHTVGISEDVLGAAILEGALRDWWQAYLVAPPRDLPTAVRRPEMRLTMPLDSYRLTARYDLLAIEPRKRVVIVDWKTSERRPTRAKLEDRLQTLVYRYVLVEAGVELNDGEPFAPDQVELVYWFAHFPGQTERFSYSDEEHIAAEIQLSKVIAEIRAIDLAEWPLTAELVRCVYCPYRTLCDREGKGQDDQEAELEEEQDPFDVDLEQIAEIEF
jgi:CRISPR/Cas system-associated exonuclease Cas4 (RecB family)